MYNPYEVLGVRSDATRDEVLSAYKQLRDKYQSQRYLLGEAGEEAAEKLQQIEIAYQDAMNDIDSKNRGNESFTAASGEQSTNDGQSTEQSQSYDTFYNQASNDEIYKHIEELIKSGDLAQAQQLLDDITNRDAEWHYIQSIVFYSQNWFLESKRQLEFAINLEPDNKKYSDSLNKLNKILASNTISPDQMRTTSRPAGTNVGGSPCTGSCCSDLCMADCCCECMGGDLIPCC